jgi:hypothetical protein
LDAVYEGLRQRVLAIVHSGEKLFNVQREDPLIVYRETERYGHGAEAFSGALCHSRTHEVKAEYRKLARRQSGKLQGCTKRCNRIRQLVQDEFFVVGKVL